uniref:Uncharacterized protein n=1 Tax=Parascaris equorum TaxID=6256 RepID=A0A914RVB0_PAREQ
MVSGLCGTVASLDISSRICFGYLDVSTVVHVFAIPEEPPKVQAQPVPRVRIGLGSRMQAAQQACLQPSSAASSLEDSGISNMSMGVQAIRPH